MAYDFSQMSDADLDAFIAGAQPAAAPSQAATPPPSEQARQIDFSKMSDAELDAFIAGDGAPQAAPRQPAPRMTSEERIASRNAAIARARQPGDGETGFWGAAGEALAEGAKGAARAVKSGVKGFVVDAASGLTRLAGTPIRAVTGWAGLHRLADMIDKSYDNFGASALESEYGNPEGWAALGEKLTGVAGSLGGLAAGGAGIAKGVGMLGKAGKAAATANRLRSLGKAGEAAEMLAQGGKSAKALASVQRNALPAMFGNNAAVQAYDTARQNHKSKAEAAALAGLNGAIHFLGFKAFENQSLNKMLGMPQSMEAMMPKWAGEAIETGAPKTFTELARSVRNGMIKYTLAERGKGALKAGGIMALQDMLSDIPMQVAEGGNWDDIDFNRVGKKGLEGLGEGVFMEGAMGAAAMLRSNASARKFLENTVWRGKGYTVVGEDGKEHDEPGFLTSAQGRMALMKQNPDATERVLDIIEHGGKARPDELDAAFLPPDMNEAEQRKFAADWRKDLEPYVEEAWNADGATRPAPAETSAGASREFLSPDEARAQQKAINDAAERGAMQGRVAARDRARADEQERYNAQALAREERKAKAGQADYDQMMLEREEARAKQGETPKTGEMDEAGNGADEAQAQPEQGRVEGRPAGAEEARPVEEEPKGTEAPQEGVVERPPAENRAEEGAEPVGARPAAETGKDTPKAEKPVEAPSRASDATPAVSAPGKANDAQKAALAKLGEGEGVAVTSAKMGKGGVLRVKYTMPSADGRVVEFDSTIDAEGKTSTSVAGVKAEPAPAAQTGEVTSPETPAPATQAQTNIPNEKNSSPAPAPKSNRLRRADGTDPLAEKEQAAAPAPVSRTVRGNLVEKRLRPILDFVRNEDGSFNPDALRNHDGNNGLPLKDLKLLNEHPEIIDDLGLPAEDAAALKSALKEAYNTQRVATPNSKEGKVSEAGQFNYSVSASKALERLAKHPNNPKVFAIAQQQVSAALEAAKRQTDENGRKNEQSISFWQERLDELNTKFDALPKETQGAILRQAQSLQGKLQAAERKGRKSNTTAEGKEMDIPTGGIGGVDEGTEGKALDEAIEKQLQEETSDVVRLNSIAERDDRASGSETPRGIIGASDGKRKGRRYFRVEGKQNGKVLVQMLNEKGKPQGVPQPMSRKQWKMLAEADLDKMENADLDPANPQKGDLIRMSKSDATDLPDVWTPETQKPLENFANKVLKPTGLVKDFEFAPRPEKVDGANAITRKDGTVVGEYDRKTGKAKFFPGARPEDVTHEFTHGLFQHAESEAAAGRPQLKETIDNLVKAMPKVWKEAVGDKYADRPAAEVLEEIFTNGLARLGETGVKGIDAKTGEIIPGKEGSGAMAKAMRTLEGKAWYNRAWNAIKELYRDFMRRHGWYNARLDKLDRMSPDEAARHILSEMAKGRNFGDAKTGGEGTRNAIADSPSAGSQGGAKVTPAEDAAYMDAVKRGDMETAQRMVREAAARAMPNTKVVDADGQIMKIYHGSRTGANVKIFKTPTFFSDSRDVADMFKKEADFVLRVNGKEVAIDDITARQIADELTKGDYTPDEMADWGSFAESIKDIEDNGKSYGGRDVISDALAGVGIDIPLDEITEMSFKRVPDIYECYVNIEKPLEIDFKGKTWGQEGTNEMEAAVRDAAKNGYDGVIVRNIREGGFLGELRNGEEPPLSTDYIPISPNQIKSAEVTHDDAGNVIPLSQRFNQKSNDIRESRRVVLPKPPTTKDVADWLDGKDDVRRKWRRALQDKNIGIREVEEMLGITDKEQSAYYAKDRAFGKNEHELTHLQKQEVEPIVEKIYKSGGSLGLFSAYLYARHAGERNAAIKARNGTENGSGMTDEQARTIFDAVDRQGLRAAFEDAARDVWAMNRKYLQRRVDSGRMTQAEYDFLTQKYQHYVPLRSDMTNEELDIFNSTTGGWKRNELRTAEGRKSAADDPLAFSIVQNEQAIRAANANEVRKRWAGVVRKSNGTLGEIVDGRQNGTAKWTFTFGDGEKVETGSPMQLASERDDIILFKENGKLKAIKMFKGEHGRGVDLARAVTDKDVAKFNRYFEWVPRATRWMSAMRTQYVPTFIVRNLKADNLEVMLNALSERGMKDGAKFFGNFLKNEVSVAKGVKEYFKTGKSSDRYVQEAVENGLLTGGGMAAEGFTETARRLSDTLQALRGKPGRIGGKLSAAKDLVSLLNACAEYNTRMGVYKTLRETYHMSVADAVSYARDVTVNFNRKGYLTPYTNAAFMFSNAAIQGMGRAFKSMNSPHGKEVLAGLFMVGVAEALLDSWIGQNDEREKTGDANAKNLTEYDKEHSLGAALPSGHRIKTQIRNPWALPMYMGRKTVELFNGWSSGEKVMKDLANAAGNFVTEPVGGNGFGSQSEFLQTLAPTILDPVVQWATGKDYKGDDRLKRNFDRYLPDSENGRDSTPEPYKLIAKALNAMSGGNENRKGWADTSPENWQLLTETVFGGVLTDLNNVLKAGGHVVDAARGKPAGQIVRDIPFVRDTFTNMPENTSRFYEAMDRYNKDKAEFKKTTDPKRRAEMRKGKPYLFAGKSLLDGQIERVKEYRHLERGEIKVGNKWVEPKTPRTKVQKAEWRKRRLALQARILDQLG